MIKKIFYLGFVFVLMQSLAAQAQENQKLAQTGLQFLSVEPDARAAALARSVTTAGLRSNSLFFNPSGLTAIDSRFDFAFNRFEWIAGITHNAFSLAFRPWQGNYGVFGLSLVSVDYGAIVGTQRADNEQGYIKTGDFSPSAFALGLGYARAISDKFSVGGQIRLVRQDLGQSRIPVTDSTTTNVGNEISPVSVDFGTVYKTGLKSLKFGMYVRNF